MLGESMPLHSAASGTAMPRYGGHDGLHWSYSVYVQPRFALLRGNAAYLGGHGAGIGAREDGWVDGISYHGLGDLLKVNAITYRSQGKSSTSRRVESSLSSIFQPPISNSFPSRSLCAADSSPLTVLRKIAHHVAACRTRVSPALPGARAPG